MSLKILIAIGAGIGAGIVIGAGVAWVLAQARVDELRRKVKLLEDRIYEFQTRYESDLNTIRQEHTLIYNQIQNLKKTALTSEMKQKIEALLFTLEQVYQAKEEAKELTTYDYAR